MTNNKYTDDRIIEDGSAVKKEVKSDITPVHYRPKSAKKKSWLAPVVVTILSAGVIGTVLGMFIIHLFTGIENEQSEEEVSPSAAVTAQETDSQVHSGQLAALAGYVLQAGLFEEQANAEEWRDTFTSAGEPAFIWERDEQYFLLIGIYQTEDLAKQRAIELQGEGFDVFVKQWQTTEKELELHEEASEWIEQFGQVWEEALTAQENTPLLNHSEHTPQGERLENLVEVIEAPTEDVGVYLLQVMQAYDNL